MPKRGDAAAPRKLHIQMPLDMLLDPTLPRSAVILMTVLIDLADPCGIVDRTIAQLCGYTHLSDKTIRRAESVLCDRGAITIERSGRSSLIQIADAYRTGRRWSAVDQALRNAAAERRCG